MLQEHQVFIGMLRPFCCCVRYYKCDGRPQRQHRQFTKLLSKQQFIFWNMFSIKNSAETNVSAHTFPRTQPSQDRKQQDILQLLQALEKWDLSIETLHCSSCGKSYGINCVRTPHQHSESQAENPHHISPLARSCWMMSVNSFAKETLKMCLISEGATIPDHSWRKAALSHPPIN